MATATTLAERAQASAAAPCAWCGDALSSPYLRRPDGTGLHVACARPFAAATAGT